MPEFYTHLYFGRKVLPQLAPSIRSAAFREEAFEIGCQGPDFLFYDIKGFLPFLFPHGLGSKLHRQSMATICSNFFPYRQELLADPEARSYFLGLLCHYALDRFAHPDVDLMMAELSLDHHSIETELDRYYMNHDGISPYEYIFPIPDEERILEGIALCYKAYGMTLRDVTRGMAWFSRLKEFFQPRSPSESEKILKKLKFLFIHSPFQGKVLRPDPLPGSTKSNRILAEDLEAAVPVAVKICEEAVDYFQEKGDLSDDFYYDFSGLKVKE
jgi:hypothetical protein